MEGYIYKITSLCEDTLIIGKRICPTSYKLARVEILVGTNMQDAEWLPYTDFIQYSTCVKVLKMIKEVR